MQINNPLQELTIELLKMSLDEAEAVKPKLLLQIKNLGEPAKEVCTKVIDLVIEQKWKWLEKSL